MYFFPAAVQRGRTIVGSTELSDISLAAPRLLVDWTTRSLRFAFAKAHRGMTAVVKSSSRHSQRAVSHGLHEVEREGRLLDCSRACFCSRRCATRATKSQHQRQCKLHLTSYPRARGITKIP